MPKGYKTLGGDFIECSIDGCSKNSRPPKGHYGFCYAHYKRFKRYGDPLGGRTRIGERWEFIEKSLLNETDECILYPFSNTLPYEGKNVSVYRFVCIKAHGQSHEPKMEAAHECGNGHKLCINKRHLSWKTRRDNLNDMFKHGTKPVGDRHPLRVLSEELVRELRSTDEPNVSFAKRHGLSYDTIYNAKVGNTWKHVK